MGRLRNIALYMRDCDRQTDDGQSDPYVSQGRRRRGGQRGLVPPHFQKWGAQVGLSPPPHFRTDQVF